MYYLGIDLGGTNIAIGIVDENYTLLHKDSTPTFRDRAYQEIIKDMAELSLKVVKDAGVTLEQVKSIGIGSPGIPNDKEGTIIRNYNLGFKDTPIRAEMQKFIFLPVFLENDANCAALAESVAGAAVGAEHSITVTLGTGIGGGIIINKKIFSGFNNAASELGHMVIAQGGEPCTCGRKGCWEAYASATALIRQTKEAAKKNPDSIIHQLVDQDLSKINAKIAFDAKKKNDLVGTKVVDDYTRYLSEGLVNIISIMQPEIIVIGGGICKEGDYLLNPLNRLISESAFCRDIPQTQIKVAKLGNDAGIIGAAMLGKH